MMSSRVIGMLLGMIFMTTAHASDTVSVLKTSGCGCCIAWIEHLREAGFDVDARDLAMADLMAKKLSLGLRPEITSCHTAEIGGYVIEGHVPADDIRRLLDERPDAIGLAVPGMPLGSPGMPAAENEPYEVLLVGKDGKTEVFASYR